MKKARSMNMPGLFVKMNFTPTDLQLAAKRFYFITNFSTHAALFVFIFMK
jgi:hypothetical protein